MSETHLVSVPERGHTDIDVPTWDELANEAAFWSLVDQGILTVSRPSTIKVRLHGGCYVGRCLCGHTLIELCEKTEHSLGSLLEFASSSSFRVEPLSTQATELGPLTALLVSRFLDSVTEYVSAGREFEYTTAKQVGSLIGGKINVTRTVRLHSRGLRHLISFEKSTASYCTAANRVILATLHEVENLTRLVRIPEGDIARSRGLALLFSDCQDVEVLFGDRRTLAVEATDLQVDAPSYLCDVLSLAGILLGHQSFEHAVPQPGRVPRAWFLNLETLFESAVRIVIRDLYKNVYSVYRGSTVAPCIFDAETAEFHAHPDVVVDKDNSTILVGDVKYKSWSRTAAASDLYQLLTHAATFHSDKAFLAGISNLDSGSITVLPVPS